MAIRDPVPILTQAKHRVKKSETRAGFPGRYLDVGGSSLAGAPDDNFTRRQDSRGSFKGDSLAARRAC